MQISCHITSYQISDRPIILYTANIASHPVASISDRSILLCTANIISHPIAFPIYQSSKVPCKYHIKSYRISDQSSFVLQRSYNINVKLKSLFDQSSFALRISYHILSSLRPTNIISNSSLRSTSPPLQRKYHITSYRISE